MPITRRTVRRLLLPLVLLAAVVATVATPATADAAPLRPIAKLDVDRYLGQWWQLATIPAPYSINCARDTNANYSLINPTTIRVDNRCTTFTGQRNRIIGQAKVIDTVSKAQLLVTFPSVPEVLQNKTPNYIVSWVADGPTPTSPYQFAIVGDPTRLSGFVLSRKKVVTTAELRMLKDKAASVGYNTCTLLVTPTTGGRTDYSPLCTV